MAQNDIVDLRSDTVTRPTPAMREAMASAEVGDDVFGDDPTVNALQDRSAALVGKEAALFVPSGAMANLVAILSQTHPGETVILTPDAHPYKYEAGGIAMVGGLLTKTVDGEHGVMAPDEVERSIVRTADVHRSETTLIAIENTTNLGTLYPFATIAAIRALADTNGMKVHCDGARLFNAVVASGISAAEFTKDVHTVSFCFSKGLGAPVGSIVAGPCEVIDRARKFRKMLGGGMRQAGILAAGALHGLDHHVERLADDHRRAREFRAALEGVGGVSFPQPSPTNIVFFDVYDAAKVVAALKEEGVWMLAVSPSRIRAVFHLDVDDAGTERAAAGVKRAVVR